MNSKDKKTLETLKNSFNTAVDGIEVPEKLQKDNIIKLLNNGDRQIKDFSVKTGTNRITYIRRICSAAAIFIFVISAALIFGFKGRYPIFNSNKTAESGFAVKFGVRNMKNREDIEKAIQTIIDGSAEKAGQSGAGNSGKYIAAPVPDNPGETCGVVDLESESVKQKADIVKNDGRFLYIVTTGEKTEQIKIISAVPADSMKTVSTVVLSDSSKSDYIDECFEIYLSGNRLIALMKRYSNDAAKEEISTVAQYYDISNPASPLKIREHIQDGSYVTSEIYGGSLCLITDKKISSFSDGEDNIPEFTVDGSLNKLGSENVFMAVNNPEASYLFITHTGISDFSAPAGKLAILGSGSNVYCSADSVYVSRNFVSFETDGDGSRKSLTEIYKFSLTSSGIAPAGSCVLDGSIPSPSFISASGDNLRVVSVNGNHGNIFILNEKAEISAKLENAFECSGVSDVEYIGNRAYILSSDGSMIIADLSDTSEPKIHTASSGGFGNELFKISASEYIRMNSDKTSNSLTLTLYNIDENGEPVPAASYTFGSDFSFPCSGDGRCFTLIGEKEMFAVPVIENDIENGNEVSEYMMFSTADNSVTPVMKFRHETNYIGNAAVRASENNGIFYTVSGQKVVAFSIDTGEIVGFTEID